MLAASRACCVGWVGSGWGFVRQGGAGAVWRLNLWDFAPSTHSSVVSEKTFRLVQRVPALCALCSLAKVELVCTHPACFEVLTIMPTKFPPS